MADSGAKPARSSGDRSRPARSTPETSVAARLAHLQQTAGNAAVVRVLGKQGEDDGETSGATNTAP